MSEAVDTATATAKLLAVELGLVFTEDTDYLAAIELATHAYGMGRLAASVDITAAAERYPSAVMAPVAEALSFAARVAAETRPTQGQEEGQ